MESINKIISYVGVAVTAVCFFFSFQLLEGCSCTLIGKEEKLPYDTAALLLPHIDNLCATETDELKVFAFNSGQANFIVLRFDNECAIIDAGNQDNAKFIQGDPQLSFLDNTFQKTIKAVFLTHPHDDHYNMFNDDIKINATGVCSFTQKLNFDIQDVPFYLGGHQNDWMQECDYNAFLVVTRAATWQGQSKENRCNLLINGLSPVNFTPPNRDGNKKIKKELLNTMVSIICRTGQMPVFCYDITDGAPQEITVFSSAVKPVFFLFDLWKTCSNVVKTEDLKENKVSQVIAVQYAQKTILFTGDAEGDTIRRMFGLLQEDNTWPQYPQMKVIKAVRLDQEKYLDQEKCNAFSQNRNLFFQTDILFVPHHGTNSENSQMFLTALLQKPKNRCFVVSSSPFGKDCLPKWSSLAMIPSAPTSILHPFLYKIDDLLYKYVTLEFTDKSMYLTGAEPSSPIIISIRNNALNMYSTCVNDNNIVAGWHPVI